MTNIIGQTLLNQFRVDSFVASGGMGAVYRVWDLKRNVPLAMKVLHADLADDPAVLKRFQREANALKRLAHPNIVPFYGLFHIPDFIFLLESFVDGPSLKDVLRRQQGKPLPVKEALVYLKALCAALGYAHANGVVHCDVKPGNVMIDRGGQIFLTDFGIARHSESTTTTIGVAGTPAYMAPEQIRGESVSAATDVYALGVLLFELLTGQRPFRGTESSTEQGGATANERIRYGHLNVPAPDPRSINPALSGSVARAILRALNKKPEDRFQKTQDFFLAICSAMNIPVENIPDRIVHAQTASREEYVPGPVGAAPAPPQKAAGPRKLTPFLAGGGIAMVLLCGVAIAILAIGWLLSRSNVATPAPTSRPISGSVTSINIGPTLNPKTEYTAIVTLTTAPQPTETIQIIPPTSTPKPLPTNTSQPSGPSGKIVYACQVNGKNHDQLCIISPNGTGQYQLTNDNFENFYPSFSPDGQSVVFSSNRSGQFEICEITLNGNLKQLTSLGDVYAPEISPDGRLVVFTHNIGSFTTIWLMQRDGGSPHKLFSKAGKDALDPTWSADGRQILFAVGNVDDKRLYIMNADGSGASMLNSSFSTRGRSDWSVNGLIVSYSGASWHREIFVMNPDGSSLKQISTGGNVQGPSFSPDGNWIAFTGYIDNMGNAEGCDIYISRIDGTQITRLTNNNYCDYQPRWGP
jgi:TolB protein